ncbi:MAG: DNA mismatch repair protein MutL [Clostridiaceae bacterium]|nr:DNA mismatch repair protein MutL [Clostridiaceae bacterium]
MKVDLLVAEIGSTTTIVNAFTGIREGRPRFLGQAAAATSIPQGDVTRGLVLARQRLAARLGRENLEAHEVFATSSAAGGLSMTVHGLVPEMTVRAAREAALGSGAVLRMVSSGKLRQHDLERVRAARPRIIMVAGGTDGGERETALFNFQKLAKAMPQTPFLYAGNADNDEEIRAVAEKHRIKVYVTENVYPSLDNLNIDPARHVIQAIFEEHIIEAPGMAHIHQAVTGPIMPTPGAVMAMAERMYPVLGDLVALDVGGATTDVHSVTEGNEALIDFRINPEPFAKRTVEGDLGVFVNRDHVIRAMTPVERERLPADYLERLRGIPEIPQGPEEEALILPLVRTCCREALDRHAGRMTELFTARGRRTVVRGRDLTAVHVLIATGGALTRLPGVTPLVMDLLQRAGSERLFPPPQVNVMMDKDYLMASCGVIARTYPEAAVQLMMDSLKK